MPYLARLVLLVVCSVVLAVPASAAQGQDVRTLAVRDGKVYIDGRPVEARTLPAGLSVEGLDVQFSVIGEARPVLELDGRRYRLDGRRLVDLGPGEGAIDVVFRTAPDVLGAARRAEAAASETRGLRTAAPDGRSVVMAPSVGVYNLTGQRPTSPNAARVVWEADVADQAREALAAFEAPRREFAHYLADVQRADRALFERLQREHTLELRSFDLAARIRALSDARRRAAMEEQLRYLLEESFELKQENRRREIEQLEAQLDALRERLQAREDHQDTIIERRLRALLGEADDGGW